MTFAAEDHVGQEGPASCFIIVPVDLGTEVFSLFPGIIQEVFGEFDAVLQVVGTAAPFPGLRTSATIRSGIG